VDKNDVNILIGILGLLVAIIFGVLQTSQVRKKTKQGKQKSVPVPIPDNAVVAKRPSWIDYVELFQINDYRLAYYPVINDWTKGNPINYFSWDSFKISLNPQPFVLDEVFQTLTDSKDYRNDPSCRLDECSIESKEKYSLLLKLQETSYGDYLRSGEHLDNPYPDDPRETFRSTLGSIIVAGKGKVKPERLTNICGVGIFLVTKDNKIIVTKHSDHSHVYPGRLTFSASGLMKWGTYPHPFMEIARKAFQEIQFQVMPDKTKLIGFGADARKLYFQFSFVEQVDITSDQIIARYEKNLDHENKGLLRDRPRKLTPLSFDLEEIRNHVLDSCWEPSAEAVLLTLCAERFGADQVAQALHARHHDWERKNMLDEWDYRASRKGHLPDMSVRYPPDRLESESQRYVDVLLAFMGNDILGKNIVEIGCGTGSITEQLVDIAGQVTCVDLSGKMIEKNRDRLGTKNKKVYYEEKFGQDYSCAEKHDAAICSRVLIHNVFDSDIRELVRSMCKSAKIVFVFEDVSQNRPTSETTRIRSVEELVRVFAEQGFEILRSSQDNLFNDNIALLKFGEKSQSEG
jgi:2-polyprenyl-3-methyl-5-hydroxy-6-metoxy-1,4-benzoquinol methylase